MSIKVSVVIPTYNRMDTLPRAIDSILLQTFQKWEIVIVDDGSMDNTRELVQHEYLHDSRVKFIERPESRPKGANACRNIGMEKATGEYIALLDSDDEWKENHMENCIGLAREASNFHGCYSGAIIKKGKYALYRESRPRFPEESYIDFLIGGGFAPTPSLFMDRNCALKIKFDETLQSHQDWDFFIRFGKKFSWAYNDAADVMIHWDVDPLHRKFDFGSCIAFYKKHCEVFGNEHYKKKYLYSMYKKAVVRKADVAVRFYRKELKKTGRGNTWSIRYPYLLRNYELLKSKLQVNRLKQIVKFFLREYPSR